MSEEDKKRVKLVRMPDGSIRPATDVDGDIGDVWATQQFIREQEEREELLLKQQPKVKKSKRLLKKAQKKASVPLVVSPMVESPKATAATPVAVNSNLQRRTSYRNQGIPTPSPIASTPTTAKEISISLTVPKLKVPKKHAKKVATKLRATPKWAYALVALLILPAFIVTLSVLNRRNPTKKGAVAGTQAVAIADYKTLAPDGDVTNTTSQKINYDAQRKVSSFTDKINGYEVTVSMQPIPSNFKPAIGENVKKVAEQFSANTVLNVDNGAAYLGTSPKGPQSFVGYRGDLLVFMTSQQKIADKAWADYFNSLK